ncbi:MAG TPA: hypothetical protein VH092_02570, partial [Urbifossiella sp.]|nr:hypothetical protein [Urbifossiella sp.]
MPRLACPTCSQPLNVPDGARAIRCPACRNRIDLPAAPVPVPVPPPSVPPPPVRPTEAAEETRKPPQFNLNDVLPSRGRDDADDDDDPP